MLDYKASRPDTPYCYDVVTQEALQIGNSDTVGFIIAVLQIASSPDDRIRIAFYNRYLGRNLDEPPTPDESAWIGRLRLLSLEEAFSEIVLFYRLAEKKDEIAYIQALEEQIHAFGTSRIADIPLFLQWWDESGRTQSIHLPRNRDAINIITIHKSKGLQYKAVCIPYCNWSLQPKNGQFVVGPKPQPPFDTLEHVPLEWNKALAEPTFRKPISAKRFSPKSITSTCSTWRRPAPKRNCTSSSPERAGEHGAHSPVDSRFHRKPTARAMRRSERFRDIFRKRNKD